MADSRRKGSRFLKSNGTFFNKKTAGKLAFLRVCLQSGLSFKESPFFIQYVEQPCPKKWVIFMDFTLIYQIK
ncbi:hypothetical protein CN380_18845 [Bacillus sp. AFS017274]|nr:hypothetical protein CN380_18845 [Bacillus sp. AFS017274]